MHTLSASNAGLQKHTQADVTSMLVSAVLGWIRVILTIFNDALGEPKLGQKKVMVACGSGQDLHDLHLAAGSGLMSYACQSGYAAWSDTKCNDAYGIDGACSSEMTPICFFPLAADLLSARMRFVKATAKSYSSSIG